MEFWVKIADIVSSKRFYGPIVVIIGVIFIYKIIIISYKNKKVNI